MNVVVLGLSVTSSWGNGHATTYRALLGALAARGHDVLFLERNVPWYAENRDLPDPGFCRVGLYETLDELRNEWGTEVERAELVIVGSYVPDGAAVGDWVLRVAGGVRAFYDIDTPVTLERLASGLLDYLRADQIPAYDIYLSFTGGRTLDVLEQVYGARMAKPLYCSVDPEVYRPQSTEARWDLGYLGTYSADRQPGLECRLFEAARCWPEGRFIVAGAQFPDDLRWPANVTHITHLPPGRHPAFYSGQRYTLNVTRAAMIAAGHSPSVRLFEAAACGTPIISDEWTGLGEFFEPGREILISSSPDDTLRYLRDWTDARRLELADRARHRVLTAHTAGHRARELERYWSASVAEPTLRRSGT